MPRLFKRKEEFTKSLWDRMVDVALSDVAVLARGGVDQHALEELEELLIGADFGVPATVKLVDRVERLAREGKSRNRDDFLGAVQAEIRGILEHGRSDTALRLNPDGPTVFLVVGVNGVGKTTTIGKLAHRLIGQGRSLTLTAADTFRAGATLQLACWAERVGAGFVGGDPGRDPAAVAFDAVERAVSEGTDVLIVDTAGRLHTQRNLMEELEKVHRVLRRKLAGAPHETLMVVDATLGQNSMAQVGTFGAALDLTGIVLAKLDGTAKGGIVVALKEEFDLPVKFAGVGEGVGDLVPFRISEFSEQVLTV
ncbi:MAG: signal recognition particle-docking protein FtsY [Longimicrobiaceae bacterium]